MVASLEIARATYLMVLLLGKVRSMKDMPKSQFIDAIEETKSILMENSEWRERYASYAKLISENKPFIKRVRNSFHEWSPLNVYLNITSAKNAKNSVGFELRYMGQAVAMLKGNKDKKHILSTPKNLEKTNLRDFGCDISLSGEDWCGEKAGKFRNFFKKRSGPRKAGAKGNEEHCLQSLLLTEFSKTRNKVLRNIKPVTIGGVRFSMPTPISASNHKKIIPAKLGKSGGGIDILARIGTGGRATHLCIMELKDENKKSEPPKDAIKQSIAYTTFIHELLRSDSGMAWWKLFGFSGEIPLPLTLYAACVMPSTDCNDYSFRDMELDIEGDTIKIHYLYFQKDNPAIIKPGDTTLGIIG